jgi:hypothetical protein
MVDKYHKKKKKKLFKPAMRGDFSNQTIQAIRYYPSHLTMEKKTLIQIKNSTSKQ